MGSRAFLTFLTFLVVAAGCGKASSGPCGEDCARTGQCKEQSGLCIAVASSDCKASEGCKQNGRCSLEAVIRSCVAGSDADCAQSVACKEPKTKPVCNFSSASRACTSEPGCAATPNCKMSGACQDRLAGVNTVHESGSKGGVDIQRGTFITCEPRPLRWGRASPSATLIARPRRRVREPDTAP